MLDIRIAKPCDQSWTAMKGDERVRHCQRCDHNVYNIAEMTEREVEELIRRTEGRFCARVYRRTDNRVMTRDCPRGVAAVRRRAALALTTACAAVFWSTGFLRRQPESFTQAKVRAVSCPPVKKAVERIDLPEEVRMGEMIRPVAGKVEVTMGVPSIPERKPLKPLRLSE